MSGSAWPPTESALAQVINASTQQTGGGEAWADTAPSPDRTDNKKRLHGADDHAVLEKTKVQKEGDKDGKQEETTAAPAPFDLTKITAYAQFRAEFNEDSRKFKIRFLQRNQANWTTAVPAWSDWRVMTRTEEQLLINGNLRQYKTIDGIGAIAGGHLTEINNGRVGGTEGARLQEERQQAEAVAATKRKFNATKWNTIQLDYYESARRHFTFRNNGIIVSLLQSGELEKFREEADDENRYTHLFQFAYDKGTFADLVRRRDLVQKLDEELTHRPTIAGYANLDQNGAAMEVKIRHIGPGEGN
jgi:hypothetical protein